MARRAGDLFNIAVRLQEYMTCIICNPINPDGDLAGVLFALSAYYPVCPLPSGFRSLSLLAISCLSICII